MSKLLVQKLIGYLSISNAALTIYHKVKKYNQHFIIVNSALIGPV